MKSIRLTGYPGIAVAIDGGNPFFCCMVTESLARLKALSTGEALLKAIAASKPGIRGDDADGFAQGANVTIHPISGGVTFVRRGVVPAFKETGNSAVDNANYKVWHQRWSAAEGALAQTKGDVAHIGGNSHSSKDGAAAVNGTGTVAKVNFSNALRALSSGLDAPPFIGLGHELIHALHSLNGDKKNKTDDEENRTVGLKQFAKEPLSENALRKDAGLAPRKAY